MFDSITLKPADFTIDELKAAAMGKVRTLNPQMAAALLAAKLGKEARVELTELARGERFDVRARSAAIRVLGSFPEARDDLFQLANSPDRVVAEAAMQALRE